MKARIFFILLSALLLFSIPAQAAARFTPAPSATPTATPRTESLESKTDSELISLYREIQSILLSRSNSFKLSVPAGRYLVGVDLPSGVYRMECKGAYSSANVKVYASTESKTMSDMYIMAELYNSSVIGKIELKAGNVVEISGSVVDFTSFSADQIALSTEAQSSNDISEKDAAPIGVEGMNIYPGKYRVGSEIPAGTYRVVCENPYGMAEFSVYDSEKAVFPISSTLLSPLLGMKEIGKIELNKGDYVVVAEGSVKIYKYQGIGN